MTFCADGTCHHNVNYNSHDVNLKAESYELKDGAEEKCHVTCFFGIQSSLDATSKQAMKDWTNVWTTSLIPITTVHLEKGLGTSFTL